MANSLMQIISDGSLSTIPLTIKFFEQSHIKVFVNNVELPGGGYTFTWTGATTLTITPAVAHGAEVSIRRKTPANEVLHDFQAGAVFSEVSVDENFRQELFLLQEASEQSFITDLYDNLNMHGNKLTNLGEATSSNDAVSLGQVETLVEDSGGSPYVRVNIAELYYRSYAALGYHVVGTFREGFAYVNANDVGIDEETGKGFTGPAGPVAAGTNPASGGFVDVSKNLHYQFDSVAIAKSQPLPAGVKVSTLGYYQTADGGGGEYVVRGVGFPIALDAAGLIHHVLLNGNVLELQFSEHLNYLQAGGKDDWNATTLTGSDNTPILQNAINYLFPFVWQGSVSATNNQLRSFRCPIFVPGRKGKYMLGSVVKINPHTAIIGPEVQHGFFTQVKGSEPVGAFFVPKFSDKSKFIFDSAPYGVDGIRNTDPMRAFSNADMDSSLFTRCPAVVIHRIYICPDSTTNEGGTSIHFSPLRVVGGECSSILDNYFGQTLHGPSIQASWDYEYDGNLVQTFDSALSIFSGTTGRLGKNYCSKIGQLRMYSATLPDWWPTADGGVFIDGDVNTPASIVIKDVTGGKVSCGVWINEAYGRAILADNSAFEFDILHSETIETTLIAARGCIFSARAGLSFLPSNRLFRPVLRISGCKVSFSDFSFGCCGPMASYIDAGCEVNLLQGCRAQNSANGTAHQGLIQSTHYTERANGRPSIFYADFDNKSIREIYVNVSGVGLRNDAYYGYDDNSAMVTLQAALGRVKQNSSVNILLRNNSSAPTSETFTATPAVTGAKVSLSLRFTNRPFAVTGTVYLSDAKLAFGTGLRWSGTTAFELERSVEVDMGGDSVVNYSGQTFKVAAGRAASLTLLKTDTASFNSTGAFSDAASVMSVLFMNASTSTVVPAGGWGAKTKVL